MAAIFPTSSTQSATGAATAESADTTIAVPGNAVELVKVRAHVHATQGDPAESISGVVKIKGQDWKNTPYEFFTEIGSSKLGAIDECGYEREPRWWPAHLPVKPGGTIAYSYEPIDALANNGQVRLDLQWSTAPTGGTPIQRLCTRETATTTTTGAALTIVGAAKIVEYTIAVSLSTVAADDPIMGKISVNSGSLLEQQTLEATYNVHAIEATSGRALSTLMHHDVDIGVKNDPVIFACTLTETTAPTTAGQYAYSIGYIPTSIQR